MIERERERERRLHSREEIEYRECLLIIFLCWFSCIYTLFNYINIILYYTLYNIPIIISIWVYDIHTYVYNIIYIYIINIPILYPYYTIFI